MQRTSRLLAGLFFTCFLSLAASVHGQSVPDNYSAVTEDMLIEPPAEDWPMWRRTYGHWGHSPLDQIDASNVGSLRLAWAWTMADGRQETTPLVHDGMMFLVQACDFVEALDLRDGSRIWQYRRDEVEHAAPLACVNRNGVLYEDKLFIATHDAHLVALNARTGEIVWDVAVGDWTIGQHYSGGPMIIKNRVVAGMSGCYYLNTRCWISAHNVQTGAEEWRTYTIPGRGEYGYDSWGDVPDEDRRGGSAWNSPSYDPELNLLYTGVGVPIPWGSVQRGTGDGDVLYTNSTLALNADTGEIVWYFQHIANDEWDLDHPFARLVVETEVSPGDVEWKNNAITPGNRRKIVTGIPGKTGIVWALDAATGAFLWGQPTNVQNVIEDIDAESRRAILNPALKFPQVGETIFVCPSYTGGINWQATGYDPGTNTLFAPTNNVCMDFTLNEFRDRSGFHHGSARGAQTAAPGFEDQIGQFTAIDLTTGERRWVYRQRAGIGGSVLTTGGGLVFVSDDARRFRAFNADNGEILWEQILNSSAGGFPVSYMHEGVQYIAIASGGGINFRGLTPEIRQPPRGNMLFVFRLP